MVFINNKYSKWYFAIIQHAMSRPVSGYTESHHIVPRSLGGSDDIDNLVALTAREHFVCHILLSKMTEGQDRGKMLHAIIMMGGFQDRPRYINSRLYSEARTHYAAHRSKTMRGEGNHRFGVQMSEATKTKISEAKRGKRHWTNGTISVKSVNCPGDGWIIGRGHNPNFKHSDEHKQQKKEQCSGGRMNWWNDGIKNARSVDCPGPEWERGRLMSPSLYAKFCKKA